MKWLLLGIIAVAVFLPSSPPLHAAESAPQPHAQAVIIGGGRTEDDAKRAINEFRNMDLGKVTPAEGFPKILSSDDVPGAPPDTYIAVLGYCDPVKSDKLVRKILSKITSGAYSIMMARSFENACPTLAPELLNEASPPPKQKIRK